MVAALIWPDNPNFWGKKLFSKKEGEGFE